MTTNANNRRLTPPRSRLWRCATGVIALLLAVLTLLLPADYLIAKCFFGLMALFAIVDLLNGPPSCRDKAR